MGFPHTNRQLALILAAGSSNRMGQDKRLLRWRGETLLRRACHIAQGSGAEVFVALDAPSSHLCHELPAGAQPLYPCNWQQGMGSTLAASVDLLRGRGILNDNSLLLVMNADQPLLTREHLRDLFSAAQIAGAAASTEPDQADHCGTPAVFGGDWIPRLAQLSGERGARDWLRAAHRAGELSVLALAECPDIDTPDDWEHLQRRYSDHPS